MCIYNSQCVEDLVFNVPNATGSELSPGEATIICSRDSLLLSILNTWNSKKNKLNTKKYNYCL